MRLPLPVVRTVIGFGAKPFFGPGVPIAVQRRVINAASSRASHPKGVTTTRVVLGGRPALRFEPDDARPGAVLWAHGGAFIIGSPTSHSGFASRLALATGVAVYLLDYRLAPEHMHPSAVNDLTAALVDVPEERVVLGGDSAGGCLALFAAHEPPRPLAGLALVSPVVDLTRTMSDAWRGTDHVVRAGWAKMGIRAMFGDERPVLPVPTIPTVVHVSEHERLRPEGEKLAADAGAELVVVQDGWHDIHLQAGLVRRADEALAQLAGSITAFLTA